MQGPTLVTTEYRGFRIEEQGRDSFAVIDPDEMFFAMGLKTIDAAKAMIDLWMEPF
jgi:hypothetical protein